MARNLRQTEAADRASLPRGGLFTISELAERTGLTRARLQYASRKRKIPPTRCCGVAFLFDAEQAERLLEAARGIQTPRRQTAAA